LPENLESYFQEAGRAGRDEKSSFAFILYENNDIQHLKKRFVSSFPKIKEIKNVYNALGNYLQLAVGSGKFQSFDFDLIEFCEKFKLSHLEVYNSLKFLEREGYLLQNEGIKNPSRIFVRLNREDIYRFQVETPIYDAFIKLLLRSYSGLFTEYVSINEKEIAKRSEIETEAVKSYLNRLKKFNVIDYIPQTSKPQIVFTQERTDIKNLLISKETYQYRKQSAKDRLQSVVDYVQSDNRCRSQLLLAYFGEKETLRCGKCDVCRERNRLDINELEFDNILEKIKPLLISRPHFLQEVIDKIPEFNENKIIKVIRWLQDNYKIETNDMNQLKWFSQSRLKL